MRPRPAVLFLLPLLLFLAVTGIRLEAAEEAPLVTLDSSAYGDPNFDVRIVELERKGNLSKVRIVRKRGGPTGTALFTTQAMYQIAKARGTAYFIPLREETEVNGSRLYLVGFTDDDRTDPKVQFGEAGAEASAHKQPYLSVAQFALLFEHGAIAPKANGAASPLEGK